MTNLPANANAFRLPVAHGGDPDLCSLRLERSDNVLWSLTLDGIILHHLVTSRYMELDGSGYRLWGLLDGARSVDEVTKLALGLDAPVLLRGVAASLTQDETGLLRIIEALLQNGFIVEVET